MANQLYKVKRSDGVEKAFLLATTATLATIRQQLTSKLFMADSDSFLLSNVPVDRDQEDEILLSHLVPTGDTITIGVSSVSIGTGDADRNIMLYRQLSLAQKQALFSNIEVMRGLRFDASGLKRSFKDIVSWGSQLPAESKPRVMTQVLSDYSFNKTTFELKKTGVEKTSLSFDSPYASAEAEYTHEKSKTTSNSKVTEYMLSKYIVRKVALSMDIANMVAVSEFVEAVRTAVKGLEQSINGYSNLLGVLETWGYYVPGAFTLGGSLYATKKTEIKDFSEADTEKNSFSASFKAKFKEIGGGAAYSNAQTTEQTTTSSSKYEITTLDQVGGIPGTDSDYTKWMASLDPAVNWDAASYEIIIPSLALLWKSENKLASDCVKLVKQFYSYGAVKDRQPFLSMYDYANQVQSYYNSPW